jgi:hypothetical protein
MADRNRRRPARMADRNPLRPARMADLSMGSGGT